MRLLSVGTVIRRWLSGLRAQPVVLSSERPPSDCAAQLVKVTAQRGLGAWYRDPQNYLYHRGDPRLLGTVDARDISVVHYPEGAGRNSFAPLLQGQLKPAAAAGRH